MRVLLVNPPSAGVFATFGLSLPPMGLLYLAAALEHAGHQVVIKDLQVEPTGLTAAELMAADLVGITADTTRITKALRIARQAAGLGKTVVMGGPHPQFAAAEILATGHVHYIVKGEGEVTFPRLLTALEHGSAATLPAGIICMRGGELVETADGEKPEVEQLPLPARHLLDLHRYSATVAGRKLTPVVTSRGCPSGCSFCSSSSFFGRGWRSRSAQSVLAELDVLYQRDGFRAVAFMDDNFTLAPQRVVEIADGIRSRGYDLKWWNFSRVDTIVRNPAMVEAMAAAGSSMVYLGIESGSNETLQGLGKNSLAGEAKRAVELLQGNGIEVYASYIIGNLNESRQDVAATIDLAVRLNSNVAQFSILTPYPGTLLHEEVQGRIFSRRWKFYDGLHLVFRHPRINRHLLQFLLIKAYFRFYRRSAKAVADFKTVGKNQGISVRKVLACVRELLF